MFKPPTEIQKTSFHIYFKTNIFEFWNPIFGFDIIRFDDYAHHKWGYEEDGKTSLAKFITKKFGQSAAKLVRDII